MLRRWGEMRHKPRGGSGYCPVKYIQYPGGGCYAPNQKRCGVDVLAILPPIAVIISVPMVSAVVVGGASNPVQKFAAKVKAVATPKAIFTVMKSNAARLLHNTAMAHVYQEPCLLLPSRLHPDFHLRS